MTTTFVRLKNRRGNKADLPKPLAEGELGFATDTRELYIGGGNQSSKNRMVQVDDYLNSQVSTQSDLDNKIVTFLLTGTEHVKGDGVNDFANHQKLLVNIALRSIRRKCSKPLIKHVVFA